MNSTGLLLCGLKENGPSRPKRPTAGPLARPKGRRDSRGAGLQPKRPRGAARGRSERGGSGAAARARRRGRNGDSGDGQGGTGRTARGGAAQVFQEGSKLTPPHPSSEFRWKDYCPVVFRHLRKLFNVDPADYMLAICGDDALRELSSPGKSGSFFYLTQDGRFMIKTVKKSELKLLIRMLPSYYKHVRRYKSSLITRFHGVHSVKPNGGQKVRFIVMGNLFCSEHQIHRRYDLKGSSYGRTADKFEEEIDETTTLKDLDLNFVFRLQRSWYKELHEQLRRDCEFLESEGIMDYSFLVGVHFRDDMPATKMGLSTFTTSPKLSTNMVSACQGGVGMPELCLSAKDLDKIPDFRKSFVRLGAHLPAQADRTSRSEIDSFLFGGGGLLTRNKIGEAYDVILYFGIIDILQDYDIPKKLEHAYKSLQTDPNSISAVDPKLYSQRFRDFICRIFIEDD